MLPRRLSTSHLVPFVYARPDLLLGSTPSMHDLLSLRHHHPRVIGAGFVSVHAKTILMIEAFIVRTAVTRCLARLPLPLVPQLLLSKLRQCHFELSRFHARWHEPSRPVAGVDRGAVVCPAF